MVAKPQRIQRKRTKGWTMPPNTVSVTRPGKWGNPFDFRSSDCCWLALSYGCRGDRLGRQQASVKAFSEWVEPPAKGKKLIRVERGVRVGNEEHNFQIGPRFIVGPPPSIRAIRAELAGKNLACFCKIGEPCHGDVLLDLANGRHGQGVDRKPRQLAPWQPEILMNPPGKTTLSRMQRTADLERERIEMSQDGRIRCGMQKEPLPGEVEKRDDFAGIVRVFDAIMSDKQLQDRLTLRMREMSEAPAAPPADAEASA